MPLQIPNDPEMAALVIQFRQTRMERILEVGLIGYLIGRGENKAAGIVVLVLFMCFALIAAVLVTPHSPDLSPKDVILSLISIITLALGYYLGKGKAD